MLYLAHTGGLITPAALWQTWTLEPALLGSLAIAALVYVIGMARLWRRAGNRRGLHAWQVAAYSCGLIALAAALVSPLDALGSVLFSAHMLQHMVLIEVAAPLLAFSGLPVAIMWVLPRRWTRAFAHWWRGPNAMRIVWHRISRPGPAWLAATAALWAWHIPFLYQAALASESIHVLEHLSFLATAILFWQVLVRPSRTRNTYGLGVLYVFTSGLQSGALGALITFAGHPWYAQYASTAPQWGLSPLEDQQLAGLIMWLPGGVLYTIIASVLFLAWLNGMESRPAIKEREHA